MSFNGSGTFLINTAGQPVVAGTVISSTAFNALTADLATGLSTVITKDGQTTVTANIPMSTYKFTGLGVGSAATDSANLSQVQSTVTKLLTSVSGADTITAVGAPVVAAYAAGQMFYFVATGDNTGAVTLNIDALGAKAVTRDGSVALAAGDIKSGEVVVVVYDGTRFQVVSQLNSAGDARFANVSIASSLYVGGVSTFVGNAGFSANVSIASALSVGGVAAITGATTIGGNLTLNGGTANGVLYLNGSKVATSGAVLVFDGTNLGLGAGSSASKVTGVSGSGTGLTVSGGVPTLAVWDTSNASNYFNLSQVGVNSYLWGIPAGALIFGTDNTERMRLTSTGLGIGTSSPGARLEAYRNSSGEVARFTAAADGVRSLKFISSDNTGSGAVWTRDIDSAFAQHRWAKSGTPLMVLDESGNLGIGTSSPGERLDVVGGGLGVGNGTIKTVVSYTTEGIVGTTSNHALLLYANNAERARITAGGNLLVGTTSDNGYHRFLKSNTSDWVCTFTNSSATTPWGISVGYSAAAPNNTNPGIALSDTGGERATIRNNGGLANYSANNVNLSDERTKKNIVPLGSMWDKFKAIEIVKFKYRDQTHDDDNIGVIAQQVESVAPEFVDIDGFGETPEDGVPFKTVYTTDMYHAAIKALQEAMARIEQLEAKFAALESK
jgi:hypothetical protein